MERQNENIDWIKGKFRGERPLTLAEETALFKLIRQGNASAKNRILCANMKFVIQVSNHFYSDTLFREELVNEGAIGLWRAIESFDYTRGVKFITYAVWWIKAFIARAISEKGYLIRLPLNQQIRVQKALRQCSEKKELDSAIQQMSAMTGKPLSLTDPISDNGNVLLENVLIDCETEEVDKQTEKDFIRHFSYKLLNKIPSRERFILSKIYGLDGTPKNIREISSQLKLSRERVRQLRDQAISRIHQINSDGHLNQALCELGCKGERV